jgi:hypothetical protein
MVGVKIKKKKKRERNAPPPPLLSPPACTTSLDRDVVAVPGAGAPSSRSVPRPARASAAAAARPTAPAPTTRASTEMAAGCRGGGGEASGGGGGTVAAVVARPCAHARGDRRQATGGGSRHAHGARAARAAPICGPTQLAAAKPRAAQLRRVAPPHLPIRPPLPGAWAPGAAPPASGRTWAGDRPRRAPLAPARRPACAGRARAQLQAPHGVAARPARPVRRPPGPVGGWRAPTRGRPAARAGRTRGAARAAGRAAWWGESRLFSSRRFLPGPLRRAHRPRCRPGPRSGAGRGPIRHARLQRAAPSALRAPAARPGGWGARSKR